MVGEAYGFRGAFLPVGHTSIYLDRVCADGPLMLRMCRVGEVPGVVISRFDRLEVDWLATPISEYLYAVDDPADIRSNIDDEKVMALREAYRRQYMTKLLPGDRVSGQNRDWDDSVGASYRRRMWGYQLATTVEQDERLVEKMNSDGNQHHYHLLRHNCADFAAHIVNFYYPGTVKINGVADLGFMTPKQVARAVGKYGHAHPEAGLRVLEFPQLAGPQKRSHAARGASELFLKSTKYLVPLAYFQPMLVVALAVLYIDGGRWDIEHGGLGGEFEVIGPSSFAFTADVDALTFEAGDGQLER